MTNEFTTDNAIHQLKWMQEEVETSAERTALNMAIEALSNSKNQTDSELKTTTDSVSANDVIYRRDVIDVMVEMLADATTCMMPKDLWRDVVTERISKLPSAQQWIPCSERLPEVGDIILGTDSYGSVDAWVLEKSFTGKLYWTDSFDERDFDLETVIAWQALPEPYKGGDDE